VELAPLPQKVQELISGVNAGGEMSGLRGVDGASCLITENFAAQAIGEFLMGF